MFTVRGVYSSGLTLSDQPVLGDWNITVNLLEQTYSKSFTVAEYILPKFEVSIDLPKSILVDQSDVTAIVRAK